ncbi:hypothetical protein [Paenibacillus piri]|uniref:hypothetical protein n=1 Tax=Paenibacillus piri TaxID=2547395 RepID=UPI00140482C9|nr:hypothetical protein [Paenibacillus piri]
MRKVIVTEFIIGEILAEDVYNKQGMLLLKAGNRVTQSFVNRLKQQKIVSIRIK